MEKFTYLLSITGLLAVGLMIYAFSSDAQAQSLSARGIATGGDTINAVVPEVGDLYDRYDTVVALLDGIEHCAEQGFFVADADNIDGDSTPCRGANAPVVRFEPDDSDPSYAKHVLIQWNGDDETEPFFVEVSEESPLIQHPSSGTLAGARGGYIEE